jgi:hypothetical protein
MNKAIRANIGIQDVNRGHVALWSAASISALDFFWHAGIDEKSKAAILAALQNSAACILF